MTADLRPRRLLLTVDELDILRDAVGAALPPDFSIQRAVPLVAEARNAVTATLTSRGLLTTGPDGKSSVHPSVVVDFEIINNPELAVSTLAQVDAIVAVAYHAVSGPLGVSLLSVGAGQVELSMYSAGDLGPELARAVPPVPGDSARSAALDVPLDEALTALALIDQQRADGADSRDPGNLGMTPEQLARLTTLDARFVGSLRAFVTAPTADEVGIVMWIAADGGWHAVDVHFDAVDDRRLVLTPVSADDLAASIAPLAAAVLA